MGKLLVLTSCCRGKREGGEPVYNYEKSIIPKIRESTRQRVYETRNKIFTLLKEGRIVDNVRRDGNRLSNEYNPLIQEGPEFSPNKQIKNTYLPAYQRYKGRFFYWATDFGREETFERSMAQGCHTLFVSGMLGLITLDEPIQAYNCFLGDDIETTEYEYDTEQPVNRLNLKVSDLFMGKKVSLFYQSLIDYIDWHNEKYDHPITTIIDLLSEYTYQQVFQWNSIYPLLKKRGIKCFHRLFLDIREPEFLPFLGIFYKNEIVGKGPGYSPPPVNHTIELSHEQLGNTRLCFTEQVQPDKFTENMLLKYLTKEVWNRLEAFSREELLLGESLFLQRRPSRPEDRADRNVHYFIALEKELSAKLGPVYDNWGKPINGTIGNYISHLKSYKPRNFLKNSNYNFLDKLEEARILRNAASHPRGWTVKQYDKSRNLIIQGAGLLKNLIDIKYKIS
jgi:hypothetical protein